MLIWKNIHVKNDKVFVPKSIHHYIPQFWLKHFSSRSHLKDGAYVFAYERSGEIYEPNVKSVAGEKGFYTVQDKESMQDTDMVEELFSQIESAVAPLIERIIDTESVEINEEDKAILDYFFALQHVRTVSFREGQKDAFSAQSKAFVRALASNREGFKNSLSKARVKVDSEEQIEQLRASILDFDKHFTLELNGGGGYFLLKALELSMEVAPCFYMKHMHIVKSGSKNVFTLSDHPIVLLPQDRIYGMGLLHSTFLIPLTPKIALMLDNNQRQPSVSLNESAIKKINDCSMFYSNMHIFSNLKSKNIQQQYGYTGQLSMKSKMLDGTDSTLLVFGGSPPPYLAKDIFGW